MSPRGLDPLLALAERVVEKAASRGADGAEAFVVEEKGWSLKIERGVVSNGSVGREFGLGLRVLKGDRLAFAYLTDPEQSDAAVASALDSARVLRATPGFAFPSASSFPDAVGVFDARVESFGVDDGADACERMMATAAERAPGMTLAGGGIGWGVERVAVANSAGLRAAYAGTHVGASLHGVLRDGSETTTGFDFAESRALDVDWEAIGRETGDLAVRSRRPKAVESGVKTVVFKPVGSSGLMEFLFLRAVLGEVASSGQSVYSGRSGERVLPEGFDVADDGLLAGGVRSAPFDDEGVPSRRTAIVEGGVLRAYLDDVGGARERGLEATSSAIRHERMGSGRSFRAPPQASGRNLVVVGPTRAFDELVRDVDDGILVYDAMGAHTANAASGDFSVNSSTVFAIEDGEVAHAAKPLMVAGNLPKALEGLAGLADDYRSIGASFSPASMRIPSMRLEGLRVTSG